MTYRVEVTPEFEQDLARLDPKTARPILGTLDWLVARPEAIPAAMKHLPRDLAGLRKSPVGDDRVSIWLSPSRLVLPL